MTITRIFTKSKAAKLEKITGVRITSVTSELRPGQKPRFVKVGLSDQNK